MSGQSPVSVGTPTCDAITPASLDSNVLGSSNKPQAQAAACVVEGGPKASLTISRSNLLAKLTFHKGAAPSTMSMGDLLLLTKERGLHDTAALRESLTRALTLAQSKANAEAGPNANPDANVLQQDVGCIIARGKPAKHATSPQLRLVIAPTEAEAIAAKPVGNKLDSSKPASSQTGSEEARTDHRARSSLRIIRRGDTIAIITPPQAGVDGEDVRGVLLRATAAAPLRTTLHASVKALTDGRVIAMCDGCLHATPEELAIRSEFHIAGNVDYSTGNIDVPGSVFIAGGVADCFVVKASTDIRVAQLVDAASLEAGRDLHLEQGAAGRNLVQHRCGRDFCAPTISGLDVFVGRHASVKHEIADCRLHVQGSFDGPSCTLVRGELHAAGGACLGTLGSAGAGGTSPAMVVVGLHPDLDALARKLATLRDELKKSHERSAQRVKQLSLQGRLTAQEAEELTELTYQDMQSAPTSTQLLRCFRIVMERIASSCKAELRVTQRIEAGAKVVLVGNAGPVIATFHEALRGPICISGASVESSFDAFGNAPASTSKLACREASVIDESAKTSVPLASVARVAPWSNASNYAELCKIFGLELSTLLDSIAMQASMRAVAAAKAGATGKGAALRSSGDVPKTRAAS